MFVNETVRNMELEAFTHPASVNVELGQFLYGLTRSTRPSLIVEIGCYIGFSSLHFAQALKENRNGKIFSIDLFEPHERLNDPLKIAEKYLGESGLESIVHYVKGDSVTVEKQLSPEIGGNIDILFIDGDHSVKGVLRDFNGYYDHVKPGGYILLHDINPAFCGVHGPRVLIDLLKHKRIIPKSLEALELTTTDGYGLAVLRKVDGKSRRLRIAPNLVFLKYFLYREFKGPSSVDMTIRDLESRTPVEDAVVTCEDPRIERRSDQHGKIKFGSVPPRMYSMNVLADGYRSIDRYRFRVSPRASYNVDISLSKRSQSHVVVRRN